MTNPSPAATEPPIASAAEAQDAISRLSGVMDELLDVIEQETAHVRAGRLSEMARLGRTKTDLARVYMSETRRVQAGAHNLAGMAPALRDELKRRHERFVVLLHTNLTVFATAHAVAEGILRGVAGEISRKSSLQTYGASGHAAIPDPRNSRPLALSRML